MSAHQFNIQHLSLSERELKAILAFLGESPHEIRECTPLVVGVLRQIVKQAEPHFSTVHPSPQRHD